LPSSDEIRILDTVVHILRSQKIESFDPAKQDTLKTLIKDKVNEAIGYEKVYAVYITNFVLQ
jgi:flagellar FliL protein